MQRHLLYSLTTDMNRFSQNPRVPAAQQGITVKPGVRVHYYFCSWLPVNPLSSPVNGYSGER